MTRKDAINSLRYAGFHGDTKAWTRLYIENRVSRKTADDAWAYGQSAKASGMPCNCRECSAKGE